MTTHPADAPAAPVVITHVLGDFELRVGMKQGTMDHLRAEDSDWGRVVKAHGIAEAALNARLAGRFPERGPGVRRLPLMHRKTGKLALLASVGWLQAHETPFLTVLHRLRSVLVHDVSYLDFDLDENSARWSAGTRTRFVDAVFDSWHASNKLNLNVDWQEAEKADIRFLLCATIWRFIYDTDELLRGHRPPSCSVG